METAVGQVTSLGITAIFEIDIVVSREGRIMDIALRVEVGFEPWVKDGELWTSHLVE